MYKVPERAAIEKKSSEFYRQKCNKIMCMEIHGASETTWSDLPRKIGS